MEGTDGVISWLIFQQITEYSVLELRHVNVTYRQHYWAS